MDYKNNSNTGFIIVADCMLLSVEYIGNVHLFFNIERGGNYTQLHTRAFTICIYLVILPPSRVSTSRFAERRVLYKISCGTAYKRLRVNPDFKRSLDCVDLAHLCTTTPFAFSRFPILDFHFSWPSRL